MKAKRLAFLSLFTAFAIILSYVESVLPINFGIPGVKLGLANFVIVLVLFSMKAGDAIIINIARILIVGILFGNAFSIVFSLCGAFISFLCMWGVKKIKFFNIISISVIGGVSHNVGQLIVAAFVVSSYQIIYYIPVLIISGLVTGVLIGIIAQIVLIKVKIPKIYNEKSKENKEI